MAMGRKANTFKGSTEEDVRTFLSLHGFDNLKLIKTIPDSIVRSTLIASQVATDKRVQKYKSPNELCTIHESRVNFNLEPYTSYNDGKIIFMYSCLYDSTRYTIFVNDNSFLYLLSQDGRAFSIFHSSTRYNRVEKLFVFTLEK